MAWLCAAPLGSAAAEALELVFGDPEAPQAYRVDADGHTAMPVPAATPLGSLWKLFVFAYLEGRGQNPPDYVCRGKNVAEEAYCCAPGGTVGRVEALVKSCGLYFEPSRLGITAADWRAFWQRGAAAPPPEWLLDPARLRPESEVPVVSLLAALAALDADTRQKTMAALQGVTLEARAGGLLSHLGNRLHIKTWSWFEGRDRVRVGGFAGWLSDGTPLWLRGRGTSAQVAERAAPRLGALLPQRPGPETGCVAVRFFARYPLAAVRVDGRAASDGPLHGKVEVEFVNGRRLGFPARGDLVLERASGELRISGRFGLEDYVARVVQREGAGEPAAAGQALAVAARTYVVRHADFVRGCYALADDSRWQRVSPAPPGPAATRAAQWSAGLVLNGADGRFHHSQARAGRLAWTQAEQEARAGLRWDEILTAAYGNAGLVPLAGRESGACRPLAQAEVWLQARQPAWTRQLRGVPGFEPPSPLPRVCQLAQGRPYADTERGRIYASGVATAEDRLTLAHEYLHFALAFHPRGLDEAFVERTARTLVGLP